MVRSPLSFAASVSLIASGIVAVAYAVHGFDHDIWLVAYLFLVGFLAQLLLCRGQIELSAARPAAARLRLQVTMWNAGVLLVPAGVLTETRLPVVIGGFALLAALTSFARSAAEARPGGGSRRRRWLSQIVLIAFMTLSVFVGTALAWDTPWL
jgi:hypothetical protein